MVYEFLLSGVLEQEVNETSIILIPKKDGVVRLDDFRPINLCNVCYKIISKILVNRVRPLLPKCISPLQSAFVPALASLAWWLIESCHVSLQYPTK